MVFPLTLVYQTSFITSDVDLDRTGGVFVTDIPPHTYLWTYLKPKTNRPISPSTDDLLIFTDDVLIFIKNPIPFVSPLFLDFL